MLSLHAVDRLEVQVLVDNVTDSLSTVKGQIVLEWPSIMRAGRLTEMAGECLCCANHGLSLVIAAEARGRRHTLLFDAGPEAYAVERNGGLLGIDFGAIEAVVLSHGHWDHAGGLPMALALIRRANGGRNVPFHMHPDMFRQRAGRQPDGSYLPHRPIFAPAEIEAQGGSAVLAREPYTLLDDLFAVSGEIPRVTPYETGLPRHYRRAADGDGWEADPWLTDERFVAVRVAGKGVVVFTACSHAGVVNVLTHARALFPGERLHAVMGGLHLSGSTEAIIPETVAGLAGFGLDLIVPAHCTGWRAVNALVNRFGEETVRPAAVGKRYSF